MNDKMSNDEIRDVILRELYELHKTARGIGGISIGIRDLQRKLREKGIESKDLYSNLDYLVQKKWVRTETKISRFQIPGGGLQTSEKTTYKISDVGIDLLEGASAYTRPKDADKINVTNINGVTIVGNGNIVNSALTEVSNLLEELKSETIRSQALAPEQKLDVNADIETIQSQLSKPKPIIEIIHAAWSGIEKIVVAAEFAGLIAQITQLLPK